MDAKNIKFFEIRDAGTFVPSMAIKMISEIPEESYLLGRAGYSREPQHGCVMLTLIHSQECRYDSYGWNNRGSRTMQIAHDYIENHFDSLESGDVIDVEFILGETSQPTASERFSTEF